MSENKHTPGPWSIDPDDRPNMHWNNHIVSEANPNIAICFMAHDGTELNECGEANARRIVACVNACAGFSTETLELIASVGGMQHKMTATATVASQRGKLLAALDVALENLRPHGDNCFVSDHYEGDPGAGCNCGIDGVTDYLISTIARAKGQQG